MKVVVQIIVGVAFWLVVSTLFWALGGFSSCPDCPEPVVDTVYIGDHVDWMYFDQGVKCWDSIAVLNERLDWLAEEHFQLQGGGGPLPSKSISQSDLDEFAAKQRMLYCPDMVSIAAVDSFFWRDTSCAGYWDRKTCGLQRAQWDSLKQARGL